VRRILAAAACTADQSLLTAKKVLSEQVVNWQPSCSPYLNLCDFYLWGMLKDKEYVNYLHTAEGEGNIQQIIFNIFHKVLQ
jgi:hypothetical protein